MPSVKFDIETESINVRSNQLAIKLTINNTDKEKLKLYSLTPNVPDGVEIEEKRDSFQESAKEKFTDLCSEITEILKTHLLIHFESLRDNYIKFQVEILNSIFKTLPKTFFNSYFSLFKRSIMENQRKVTFIKFESFQFKIQSLNDAKWAYEKWIKDLDNDNLAKSLYEAKLKQLEDINGQIGDVESSVLAIIEPNSFYSRSYVIKFKRKFFSQKMFNITINGDYSIDDSQSRYRGTVSKPVTISPQSFPLTFLAICSSILGSALKYSLSTPNVNESIHVYFYKMFNNIVTGSGISSLIIAILFFNIYEHTDFGKKIKISMNWQVALLIGILSGFMGERLVDAIKIFVGFK